MKYNREILVMILIEHQRHSIRGCLCGWSILGLSHCEHIADEYEKKMRLLGDRK